MNSNFGKKIAVVGNQSTTVDLIHNLIRNGYVIDCIITMPKKESSHISGYVDIRKYVAQYDIPVIFAKSFTLLDVEDRKQILKRRLDVLLVFGWQRLIPKWLLGSLSIGAFGTHGSWRPLPYGRGRSLLNWSLILGKEKLIDNLFRYDTGADSGDIVESFTFEITPQDSISTLHHKDQLVHQELVLKNLPNILNGQVQFIPQSKKIKEVFFPKRTPDDGVLDWNWKTIDICNLIRAVSMPYPGAFTFYKKKRIMIWKAISFQVYPSYRHQESGSIVSVFSDNTFVVKTADGALLVEEYSASSWSPKIGQMFVSKHNKTYDLLREAGIL